MHKKPLTGLSKDIEAYSEQRIITAFRLIAEARNGLTIWEFQAYIEDHLKELGGAGFIASIGSALMKATPVESAPYLTKELEALQLRCITQIGHIRPLVDALNGLIAVFDGSHPYLPCEDGELPALDRARAIYGDTVRKLADGRI